MSQSPFIVCENLVKIFQLAGLEVVALQGLDLTVSQGELLAIVGSSGSGKSTLMNILGGLDRPSAGRVTAHGRDLLKLSDQALDEYRRTQVGFVWQQTARNLIPYLSAWDNVILPMTLAGLGRRQKQAWAQELLELVGLWDRRHHKLAHLSGGQQQRVAIAVALANKPPLMLGDEPTGELDSTTAQEILQLFQTMKTAYGVTIILVTHDPQVANSVERVVTIRDGRTSSEAVLQEQAQGTTAVAYQEYVVVDAVGRLQIPPHLREKMGIGQRVTLAPTAEGVLIKPVDALPTAAAITPIPPVSPPPQPSRWPRWWPNRKRGNP